MIVCASAPGDHRAGRGNARRYDGERASWLRDAQVARAGRAEQIEPEQHIDARAGHADAAFRWRRGAAHIGDHGAGLLAQAANAAFLAYAPPPAAGAGALCLADTGVNVNPDTQQELVSASAVDGGSGNDVDPDGHGTTMAMIAVASGHGMIGACPQIEIVSVRATDTPTPGQEPTFQFDDYWKGITRCATLANTYKIHAIDLALSSTIPPSPDQAQDFANAVAQAHGQNVAVLAAAGNQPGPVEEPAAESGVFAVGASTAQPDALSSGAIGSPCSFSATQV